MSLSTEFYQQGKSRIEMADRVQEWAEFPRVVLIDNMSACNLQCSMCDHINIRNYRKMTRMKPELFRKIIDEVAEERPDARVWMIFFGEPALCRDMGERIRYAKDKGLTDVVLNSNGNLVTEEIARSWIEAGLDALYVGIDAATPETYLEVRVGGDYETAVQNVLTYRRLLDECGRPDQKVFVQFVVSDCNEHELDDFREFWTSRGVHVKVRPRISWAGLIPADNLMGNDEIDRQPCYWLQQTMSICTDGQAALCAVDIHGRVDGGSVAERSVKEVWKEGLGPFRRMHLEKRFDELPEMCRDCSDWQSGYAEFHEAQES